MNEFMKLVMKNKEVIHNVHFFDEVSDYYVQGVEIRLKDSNVKLDYSDLEDKYNRPDPFKSDIPGYVYIILGFESNYQKWLKVMIEGKVANRLIRKYPQIIRGDATPELRKQIDADKIAFEKEIYNSLANR